MKFPEDMQEGKRSNDAVIMIANPVSKMPEYIELRTLTGDSEKTIDEIDKESNRVFVKNTSFPIVGLYMTDTNTLNPSPAWRTVEILGKEGDVIKYNIYSTTNANIITFFDDDNNYISSIPAKGTLGLIKGLVTFPYGATKAYLSTHNSEVANSFYETSKTLEQIEQESKFTIVRDSYFPLSGVYLTANNTFTPSENWRTVDIDVEEGEVVDYNIYSVGNANIVTFFNEGGGFVSSIPTGGATGNPRLIQGSFTAPKKGKASLSTHNSKITESYYERTVTIIESFAALNQKFADLETKAKTYVVKGNVATNANSFQTIKEALAVAVSSDLILVFSGTYNEYSLKITYGVTVRGIGYVYINGYLPVTSSTSEVENISTIDMNHGGRLENLIVTSQNMRYPIHADFSKGNTRKDILNCRYIHHGNQEIYDYRIANDSSLPIGQKAVNLFRACSAWGGGTKAGDIVNIVGCYFESPMRSFSTHNNHDFDKSYGSSTITLTDCEFVSHGIDRDGSNIGFNASIVIQSLESNSPDRVIFNNCRANGFVCFHNALTHEVYLGIKGLRTVYNTLGSSLSLIDQINIIDVTKYPIVPEEIIGFKNLGAEKILRGKAVKRNSYGIELMTSADDASLFLGVAMQDIEINKNGDVKIEGYLIRPYMDGLASIALADGDEISVTASGSFEKSATKVVCKAVDNQNVIIK